MTCICPRTDGYRIKRRGCAVHAEKDAAYWQTLDDRKFGTESPHEPTHEFVVKAFAEGARSLWPDARDPGWHVTFDRWLADRVADFQYNALDMARKAHIAEIHAEEAEYHVEQLRDALDSAERRIEQAERRAECAEDGNRGLIATCEAAGAKIQALETAIQRLREALDESRGEVGTGAGEGATGQDTGTAWVTRSTDCPEAPAQAHLPACNCVPECCESHDCPGSGCAHDWLDRPESDTRECLICGTEVAG